jgi:hypothetical protein
MRFSLKLPIALLLTFALALTGVIAAAPAQASRYRVGIGDQHESMFSSSAFQKLKLQRVRYLVPWDWQRTAGQRDEINRYLYAANGWGKEVFVTFTASRGCWNNGRYSKKKHCRAPSTAAYRKSFKAFRKAYPYVKTFAPWNEANHASQPTARSPKRAAAYYNVVRSACRGCTVLAADVLDQSNVTSWLRAFKRSATGSPKRWGLHNYSDVNRKRTKGTRAVLRLVPGEVWLTETGGVVSFGSDFKWSPKRAASRTKYMFKLADTYSKRRRGMRSRITRIYPYSWTGVGRKARFDAGFTNPSGSTRPAYKVFRAIVRHRSK